MRANEMAPEIARILAAEEKAESWIELEGMAGCEQQIAAARIAKAQLPPWGRQGMQGRSCVRF
jgi:hypothetical protein